MSKHFSLRLRSVRRITSPHWTYIHYIQCKMNLQRIQVWITRGKKLLIPWGDKKHQNRHHSTQTYSSIKMGKIQCKCVFAKYPLKVHRTVLESTRGRSYVLSRTVLCTFIRVRNATTYARQISLGHPPLQETRVRAELSFLRGRGSAWRCPLW